MDRQQEFVLRTIEERDIRFVRLWFTDVLGTLKSVAIAPGRTTLTRICRPPSSCAWSRVRISIAALVAA